MKARQKDIKIETGICRECQHVIPILRFHTLSIKGEPTLGTCPYSDMKVLLSQRGCKNFKKTCKQ